MKDKKEVSKEKKNQVKNIFDTIAFKYDLLNHLLSFGVDYYWRRKALKKLDLNEDSFLLDVACGTGDVAIEAYKQGARNIVGADFSYNMLKLFEEKASWIKGRCVQLTAEDMPFEDNTFTNITVAFGVRNFYDIQKGINSFYRVLRSGGKAAIIEFKMPSNFVFKHLYKFYFKNILPLVGGLISKSKESYAYLPKSVEDFDEKIDLELIMANAGFKEIIKFTMTFGIVQVVIGAK